MSYKLIYTIPFASVSNVPMLLDVLKDGYEGEPTELIGGATPFTVSIDDEDFLYTPLRFSTGRLKLIGSDYLQNIYSTDYQQYKVNLKRNNVIVWTGYIKPEVYTQDYSSVLFELDVECVSAMSTLEFMDYKKSGDRYTFVSLFDLIKQCVSASGGDYSAVYMPHVYGKDKANFDSWGNVLSEMTISEQNFFDEEEKPMKLKEVLEEVCKFLNWTCIDYKGSLYFFDVDYIGDYYKYVPDFSSYTKVGIDSNIVQNIGFAGTGHTLDILGGYNKVTVKNSNYSVGQLFPEEDFDKLELFCEVPDSTRKINDKTNQIQAKRYFYPRTYTSKHYRKTDSFVAELTDEELEGYKTHPTDILGTMPIYRCNYEMKKDQNGVFKPTITQYNWEKIYQYKNAKYRGGIIEFKEQLPLASFAPPMALCISCCIQRCTREDMLEWDNEEDVPDFDPVKVACRLTIGNLGYYGNLKKWGGALSSSFNLEFHFKNFYSGKWVQCNSTKTLKDKYDDMDGYLIPIDQFMYGDIKFEMSSTINFSGDVDQFKDVGIFIKDLKLSVSQPTDAKNETGDRLYENIANDKYINELDNIELKISTYNNDELSYSKIVMPNVESVLPDGRITYGKFLTNDLYSSITNANERPEELLIKRIINQYKATKIKLTQILKYDESISPLTVMYDNYMVNKIFAITGGDIDYKNESFTVKMIEKK